MGNSERNQRLIIIKLGGSVITYKDNPIPRTRISTIKHLSLELTHLQKKGYKLIIVHGAGSFGHPLAKKYKLTEGLAYKGSLIGFAKTAEAMIKLNKIIIGQMTESGLAIVTLPPRSFITQTRGKMNDFDYTIIKSLIEKNLVPVLFGDVVFDTKLGCSIVSGDTIIPYLANKLKASQVIFLSDVDGIFDKNPKKYKDAKLITKVNDQNFEKVLSGIEAGSRADVTGEMASKIIAVKGLRRVPIIIMSGLKPGNLTKALGQRPIGTELLFD